MKHTDMKNCIYTLLLTLVVLACHSCSEDPLDSKSVIEEPSGETAFDKWVMDNYTNPYNIAIKYKMEDIEASMSYYLAPAYPEKCEVLSKILQYIWLETFNEVKGIDFLRQYSPKILFYVGSYAFNSNGTHVAGTAESGMKVTIYGVNEFDIEKIDKGVLQDYMSTVIHEFAHILHQKKVYDPEFEKISSDDYVDSAWNDSANTEAIAYTLGFFTKYSRKNVNEDFVELIAHFVVYGQEEYDKILGKAGTDGAAKINKKFSIVKDYLRDTWGIDIYTLNSVFTRRLNTLDMIDLKPIQP